MSGYEQVTDLGTSQIGSANSEASSNEKISLVVEQTSDDFADFEAFNNGSISDERTTQDGFSGSREGESEVEPEGDQTLRNQTRNQTGNVGLLHPRFLHFSFHFISDVRRLC